MSTENKILHQISSVFLFPIRKLIRFREGRNQIDEQALTNQSSVMYVHVLVFCIICSLTYFRVKTFVLFD